MAELKKCPFCGSVADLHQNQAGMFVVRCVKFGCWVSTMPCDFEETAIIKWNTRATKTEAEIRAMAEHTYENCHNITCRRKCQKDGYNMAIDEFAEKLKAYIEKDLANPDLMLDCKKCAIWKAKEIDEIAEQLKEEQ